MAYGGNSGAGEGVGPLKKDSSKAICCCLKFLQKVQDSYHTFVITVMYWRLPWWQGCDCSNMVSIACFDSSWRSRHHVRPSFLPSRHQYMQKA